MKKAYLTNHRETEKLKFFSINFYNLRRESKTIYYMLMYKHSIEEEINCYNLGFYLGSALTGIFSAELFMKYFLSMHPEYGIENRETGILYFSQLIKEFKKIPKFVELGIVADLNKLNDIRNDYLFHPKATKFLDKFHQTFFRGNSFEPNIMTEDVYKDIAKEVLTINSEIQNKTELLLREQAGDEKFNTMTILSEKYS